MKKFERRALLASLVIALSLSLSTPLPAAPVVFAGLGSGDTSSAAVGGGSRPAGTLFIVGGGPRPAELMQEFVDLAGGRERARIAVFGMAGRNARGGERMADELRGLGVDAFSLFIDRDEANRDEVVRRLDGVTGIWFIGGHQTRLARALLGTKVADRIRELYEGGIVVGGTSAGAAIMSTPMIIGGENRKGGSRPPRDSSSSSSSYITIERENVRTAEGLELLEGVVIDQHFIRRKRNNRLISVVLEHPEKIGIGIDESTALVVHPDGKWTVSGESVVLIYDARRGEVTPGGTYTLGVTGMVVHILPPGGRFDPATGEAVLGSGSGVD